MNTKTKTSSNHLFNRLLGIALALAMLVTTVQPAMAADPVNTDILTNCSVRLLKEGNFQTTDTSVKAQVTLDSSLTNGCNMTIYAYAANTTFDPDTTYNKRLWSGTVRNGDEVTCNFAQSQLPLQVGYNIIACLNVPVAEDFYRPVNSQPVSIVDENGESFQDYQYPDASIAETELQTGATSLHINLSGDERIFQAACDGKITITCAVGAHPANEDFDFEGENYISLASNIQATAAFNNKEIKLSQPLPAGYKVRAVVYWSQSAELFLVKGNDYESKFNRPDDSILIAGTAETEKPTVTLVGGIQPDSATINATVGGTVPAGSILLLKSYPSDTTSFASDKGTWAGTVTNLTAGEQTITPQTGALTDGCKLVAFIINSGNIINQSQPVTVKAITLAPGSLAIQESEFTTNSTTATVAVSGCEEYTGGLLILTAGPASNTDDADSRTRLASTTFTGAGSYTLNFSADKLKAGETILPHLYKYDSDNDATMYKYGEPVMIRQGSVETIDPTVKITTPSVQADSESLWLAANFTANLTATLKLFTYEGNTFDAAAATEIYSGSIKPDENGQKISFGSSKLSAGQKLIATLNLSDGTTANSVPVTIQAVPEKQHPTAFIKDKTITAGDTYLKAALTFDSSAAYASYTLYKFTESELNPSTATALATGNLYRSNTDVSIYLGQGRIQPDDKLQIRFTVDNETVDSNIVTVEPSPDWGIPTAAFGVSSVKANATSIPVTIDYSDEYLTLGDDFYCDVTIYQYASTYTDQQFEESELWENSTLTKRVGQLNTRTGDTTKGKITVPVSAGTQLQPGSRLIIKLRLPHTEWDGEEVDYLSASVPVVEAGSNSDSSGGGSHGSQKPESTTEPAKEDTKQIPFTDVAADHWFSPAVNYVYQNRLMNGTAADTFSPEAPSTRGMIVAILHRLAKEPTAPAAHFNDIADGQYYAKAVAWVAENGIVQGYGDGSFGPDDTITCEQLAAILHRYAQHNGQDTSARADLTAFSDTAQISPYATDAMGWAVATGIIQGNTDGTLAPKANANRARVAQILMNYLQNQ